MMSLGNYSALVELCVSREELNRFISIFLRFLHVTSILHSLCCTSGCLHWYKNCWCCDTVQAQKTAPSGHSPSLHASLYSFTTSSLGQLLLKAWSLLQRLNSFSSNQQYENVSVWEIVELPLSYIFFLNSLQYAAVFKSKNTLWSYFFSKLFFSIIDHSVPILTIINHFIECLTC